mmetsp:Transcript_16808/g.50360  ORF Transcript_16808/g.50360 Transcript_16808/m.50360 type:complete len:224 (+) Transcript_16808:257-928(+)
MVLEARRRLKRDHDRAEARDAVHHGSCLDTERAVERNVRHLGAHGRCLAGNRDCERDVGVATPAHLHPHVQRLWVVRVDRDALHPERRVAKREPVERDAPDGEARGLDGVGKDHLHHLLDHLAYGGVHEGPQLHQDGVHPLHLLDVAVRQPAWQVAQQAVQTLQTHVGGQHFADLLLVCFVEVVHVAEADADHGSNHHRRKQRKSRRSQQPYQARGYQQPAEE